MKPSLKLLYYLLERACRNYSETESPFAKGRALVLVKEMHECLNEHPAPHSWQRGHRADALSAGGAMSELFICTTKNVGAQFERSAIATPTSALAQRIGTNRPSLSLIEAGQQKCAVHELLAIAEVLNVPACDLLSGSEIEP